MLRAKLIGPHQFELEEVATPEPGPGEVLIRNAYAAVCGSEFAAYLGLATSYPHYLGRVDYPRYLGHEGSGTIEALGPGVQEFAIGDHVAPRGSYASHCVERVEGLVKIPPNVSIKQASLTLMAQETYYITRYTQIQPTDQVLIVGVGPLGMLLLEHVREIGCDPIICADLADHRLDTARTLGATHTANPSSEDLLEVVQEIHPGGVSVTIDTTGQPEPMKLVVKAVASEGKVIYAGRPYKRLSDFEIEDFVHKMLVVYGAKTPPAGYHPKYAEKALELIGQGMIHADTLITHEFPLAEIGAAFGLATSRQAGLKVVVRCS